MSPPLPPRSLYTDAELYRRVFPVEEEDVAFHAALIAQVDLRGPLLDVGCGNGDLAAPLSLRTARTVIGLDPATSMLRGPSLVGASAFALPFPAQTFAGVLSHRFGYAYAHGARPNANPFRETSRVLMSGGWLAADLPLCERPRGIQGWQESAELGPGESYRFCHHDVLQSFDFGDVYSTSIEYRGPDVRCELHAPLVVYRPTGLRALLEEAGLRLHGFLPTGDPHGMVNLPPADALRGTIRAQRVGED